MTTTNQPESLQALLNNRSRVKPPAHPWQDLALRVINELAIPNQKRTAVFLACKQHDRTVIEKCLNDTKELCTTGDCWKYFFKVLATQKAEKGMGLEPLTGKKKTGIDASTPQDDSTN